MCVCTVGEDGAVIPIHHAVHQAVGAVRVDGFLLRWCYKGFTKVLQ
jgi:hypothetical protein